VNYGSEVAELARLAGIELAAPETAFIGQIFDETSEGIPTTGQYVMYAEPQERRRLLAVAVLGWMFLDQRKRTLWFSSPLGARVAFETMRDLVTTDGLKTQVGRVRAVNGGEEIETTSGSRVLFRGRTTGVRGMSLSRLILEGKVSQDQYSALMPCLAGDPAAQVVAGLDPDDDPASG
jgi:hypothetical protein